MYYVYPWWTALYFVMTCFAGWLLMWASLWGTSQIIKLSVKAIFKQRSI